MPLGSAVADQRAARYRSAEHELWQHYGLQPTERYIQLHSPPARLRVLEVGSGTPLLMVPGTGGTGPYLGALVRELGAFRCLVLDRPGWGLSTAIEYGGREYRSVVSDVMRGVLDGLGLERCHVSGASIGNVWALRAAQAMAGRVDRVVMLGGMPWDEVPMPTFIRLLASPIGPLIVRLGATRRVLRAQLRGIGHGPALDAGRLEPYIAWRLALERETGSMRSEREMVRALVDGRAWRPGLTLEARELGAIERPVLHIWGTADPVGAAQTWSTAAHALAHGELQIIDGAGHLPWLDRPEEVGRHVSRFLYGGHSASAKTSIG